MHLNDYVQSLREHPKFPPDSALMRFFSKKIAPTKSFSYFHAFYHVLRLVACELFIKSITTFKEPKRFWMNKQKVNNHWMCCTVWWNMVVDDVVNDDEASFLPWPWQTRWEQHDLALWTTMHPGGGGTGVSAQILSLHTTTVPLHWHARHGSSVDTSSPLL